MEPTIAVIGYKGVVGNATYQLFSRLGHRVIGMDLGDTPKPCDIAFVCVPERVVTAEILTKYRTGLFAVRSTVLPKTCAKLQLDTGVHVLHNPEFLREATSVMDEFNPDRIIIGDCCTVHGDALAELYKPLHTPIIRSSRTVTELAKLACNGWLATVISYWNEIDDIAASLGVSGTAVGMLASTDKRIGYYGSRFHATFGGKCLPKDTSHLVDISHVIGVKPVLLEAVLDVNNRRIGKERAK